VLKSKKMNYLITPPNTHYDNGLGITADNFQNAAKVLKQQEASTDSILPICYLQRHAIELYLKSFIVILHKRYGVPYGMGFSNDKPAIKTNDKWVLLSKVHNLSDLYQHFIAIHSDLLDKLPTTTDWKLPKAAEKKIQLVSGSDPKSTYFRYPDASNTVQDSNKQNIQKESMESILKKSKLTNEPIKCVLMYDDNDEITATYNIKSLPMPNVLKALDDLNKLFYGMHAALRYEVTNGT